MPEERREESIKAVSLKARLHLYGPGLIPAQETEPRFPGERKAAAWPARSEHDLPCKEVRE